jgi:glutaminyl-tRNA synthetase
VTKATTNIEIKRVEISVRRYLDFSVPRLMLVVDPVGVIIDNLPDDHLEMLGMPFSKDAAFGISRFYLDRQTLSYGPV